MRGMQELSLIHILQEKDGFETLEELRKDKSIPVILLSAKSEDYDKIGGLNPVSYTHLDVYKRQM